MGQWIANQLAALQNAVMATLAGLVPAPPAQLVAAAPCSTLSAAVTEASWIGRFVPWWALAIAVAVFVIVLVATVVIRVVRIAASFASFGGGS